MYDGIPRHMNADEVDTTERRRVEQALRESEERFRLAAQAGKMFAYSWDAATDVIERSGESAKILGIDEGVPLTGQQAIARVHADDREGVLAAMAGLSPEKPFLQVTYRIVRPDTSVLWVERHSRAYFDEHAKIKRIVGMVVDITERKLAEVALRTSEERLRMAQWAAHIGIFDLNIQTGVDTWTPETEALYGLSPGGFGGTLGAFENLIHPDDRERVIELTREMIRTRQPADGEWRVVWPDGSVHWIAGRGQVLTDESGAPSRMLGVNMDITERKRAELALRETNLALENQTAVLQSREELLKIFVKNVPAAVAMLDRDMRYVQVSDRWCSDYLPGRAQVLGRSHYEIFPDMPERWKEVHRRGLQGETLRADEDHWDGQDGTHWARWEVRPWRTAEGAVGGILILAEDIGRRKQMEQALADMSRKLIESQEQERARIARELHDDISQRLALLAIEIDQLQECSERPPEVRSRAEELSNRAKEISSDIQALSHELHSSRLEYLGIVGGMKSWCSEFSDRQGIEVKFKSSGLPNPAPEISLCLFRVLQEALHNAAKHSGVTRVDVELWEESGEIQLSVSDLGKGFDVAAAMKDRGLGVTSMQERVRLAGGQLFIDSKPRGGTIVLARVPLRPLTKSASSVS
jgi:PAS domain S-box-containing protein